MFFFIVLAPGVNLSKTISRNLNWYYVKPHGLFHGINILSCARLLMLAWPLKAINKDNDLSSLAAKRALTTDNVRVQYRSRRAEVSVCLPMYAMFLSIRTPECPLFAHQLRIFIDATFSDRQEPEVLIQSEADPNRPYYRKRDCETNSWYCTAERVTEM